MLEGRYNARSIVHVKKIWIVLAIICSNMFGACTEAAVVEDLGSIHLLDFRPLSRDCIPSKHTGPKQTAFLNRLQAIFKLDQLFKGIYRLLHQESTASGRVYRPKYCLFNIFLLINWGMVL